MWYDSFDNGEPSNLWQDNDTGSYQLFGTLSEKMSQDDIDDFPDQFWQQTTDFNAPQFQSEPWPDVFCSNPQDSPNCDLAEADWFAQPSHIDLSEEWEKVTAENHSRNVKSKSTVLNKIQSLESTSFALDEEIEEQESRNASIVKRIADAKEQLTKMKSQAANLQDEFQSMEKKHREVELKLDQETRQLTKIIAKKRRDISEIKHDAEMVNTLREEKDEMDEELQELREDVEEIDLNIYWIDYTFKKELEKMVIFPFWKLEEDIERALNGEDPTKFDEPGPPEPEEYEGDGYDYEDHDFFKLYEEAVNCENKEESTPDVQGNFGKAEKTSKEECCPPTAKTPENDTCQSAVSTTKVKPKGKFGKLIANAPFRRNTSRQKKQPKKDSTSSRFVRWLRCMVCIPEGEED